MSRRGRTRRYNSVKVAGSSPPPPPPIDPSTLTGLNFWIDSTMGVSSTAGAVSAWADQSGAGNNLATSSGTGVTTAASAFGAKVGIAFNGSGGWLSTSGTTKIHFTTGLTWTAVLKSTSTKTTPQSYPPDPANILLGVQGSVNNQWGLNGDAQCYVSYQVAWERNVQGSGVTDGQTHHIAVSHNAATGEIRAYVDGVYLSPSGAFVNFYQAAAQGFDTVGAGFGTVYDNGQFTLAEVITTTGVQSDATIGLLHARAQQLWGAV